MCLAKGLGGGFPMGAFAYTKAIREVLTPGAHGSTFGGSPLACAAGLAAIEAYSDEDLIKRSAHPRRRTCAISCAAPWKAWQRCATSAASA